MRPDRHLLDGSRMPSGGGSSASSRVRRPDMEASAAREGRVGLAALQELTSGIKDLAAEVHMAELLRSVRHRDSGATAKWGRLCQDGINTRAAQHSAGGLFALCAPPVWLATYRGDRAMLEVLLGHHADADATATVCTGDGRSCAVGGQTALHLAVSRGAVDCAATLLKLGAQPELCACFPIDEADEPDWNEALGAFEDGLAGRSAAHIAATRGDEATLALLLEHGASLATLPGTELPPTLLAVQSDDGSPRECPIWCAGGSPPTPHASQALPPPHPSHQLLLCRLPSFASLQSILKCTAEWTPCCLHVFHKRCLQKLPRCPMYGELAYQPPRRRHPHTLCTHSCSTHRCRTSIHSEAEHGSRASAPMTDSQALYLSRGGSRDADGWFDDRFFSEMEQVRLDRRAALASRPPQTQPFAGGPRFQGLLNDLGGTTRTAHAPGGLM